MKAYKRPQFQDGANVMDVFEYDPYDQFQQLIAQCNENTRMIQTLIAAHNKLDNIVQTSNAQLSAQIQNLNTRLHQLETHYDSK